MKSRPIPVLLIGFFYLLAASPLYLLVKSAIRQWPLMGPRGVIQHLSTWEMVALGIIPVVGIGILSFRKWGYVLFMGFSGIYALTALIDWWRVPAYSNYAQLLMALLNLGVAGYFVQKHIHAPFLNAKLRWWERQTRYSVNLAAQLRMKHTLFKAKILDLAEGGCFIECGEKAQLGEVTWVRIHLADFEFTALGKVMWTSSAPIQGFGVQFIGMAKKDRNYLRDLLQYLERTSGSTLKTNEPIGARKVS